MLVIQKDLTKPLIRIKGKQKDLHPSIDFSNMHEYFREAHGMKL